jgi:hypothetical protein
MRSSQGIWFEKLFIKLTQFIRTHKSNKAPKTYSHSHYSLVLQRLPSSLPPVLLETLIYQYMHALPEPLSSSSPLLCLLSNSPPLEKQKTLCFRVSGTTRAVVFDLVLIKSVWHNCF